MAESHGWVGLSATAMLPGPHKQRVLVAEGACCVTASLPGLFSQVIMRGGGGVHCLLMSSATAEWGAHESLPPTLLAASVSPNLSPVP